jgi:hypothetical protein
MISLKMYVLCEQELKCQVIKLEEYVEHTQDPLMQVVRTHQRNTNSTLFQTATNFKKSLQRATMQIKNTTV